MYVGIPVAYPWHCAIAYVNVPMCACACVRVRVTYVCTPMRAYACA